MDIANADTNSVVVEKYCYSNKVDVPLKIFQLTFELVVIVCYIEFFCVLLSCKKIKIPKDKTSIVNSTSNTVNKFQI